MGKASTNAGIHPYLKPDFISPIINTEKRGKPFNTKSANVMNIVNTEYKDSNKKDLYFKDEVEFDGIKYIVDYDSRNFKWILVHDNKSLMLKEVHKKTVLVKKYSAR